MIRKLTPEQEALIPVVRDKWLKIGLATGDCDFEKAKKASVKCYEAAGLAPPIQFYLFDSPLDAGIAAQLLQAKGRLVSDQVERQAGYEVRNPVWLQISDQVSHQVSDQVRDQVSHQVSDQVRRQVSVQVSQQVSDQVRRQAGYKAGYKVRDQVSHQVWHQVWHQVRDHLGSGVSNMCGGSHEAGWLSYGSFFFEAGILSGKNKIAGLCELAEACGWWAPYENAAIFQHKPDFIKFDPDKRLHCEDGPAIRYRDGFSVYAWRGTRIPAEFIESKLDVKTALTWENLEERRCAAEIIGWDRVLKELNPTVIDTNPNPQIGQLLRVEIPDIGQEQFLKVECGTGRTFALPVPPEMITAHQANAWTYGFDNPSDYQPEIRT